LSSLRCASVDTAIEGKCSEPHRSQISCLSCWSNTLAILHSEEFSLINKAEILEFMSMSDLLKNTWPDIWLTHIMIHFKENKLLGQLQHNCNESLIIYQLPKLSSTLLVVTLLKFVI